MKIREINDENSLVEVYLHWLLDNNHELDKIGHIADNKDLGIYYIWHRYTNRYCVLATDFDVYNDKRVKNPIKKYTRSICFFYPVEEKWCKLTEESYDETLRFIGKGDRDSKIIFQDTNDFGFIQNHLRKTS